MSDNEFEPIFAQVTASCNARTGYEPQDWKVKRDLCKNQLGLYFVKKFCVEKNDKENNIVTSSWEINLEKMKEYISWSEGEKNDN